MRCFTHFQPRHLSKKKVDSNYFEFYLVVFLWDSAGKPLKTSKYGLDPRKQPDWNICQDMVKFAEKHAPKPDSVAKWHWTCKKRHQ